MKKCPHYNKECMCLQRNPPTGVLCLLYTKYSQIPVFRRSSTWVGCAPVSPLLTGEYAGGNCTQPAAHPGLAWPTLTVWRTLTLT